MRKHLTHLRAWLILAMCLITNSLTARGEATSYDSADRLAVSGLFTNKDGTYFVISIEGNEGNTYCAYNLNIFLPPSLTVASDEDGLMIWPNNDDGFYPTKKQGGFKHEVSSNYINGKYKVICYSMSNDDFKATSGALLYVYVDVSPWAKAGANEITLQEVKFVKVDETGYKPSDLNVGTIDVDGKDRQVEVYIPAENKFGTCILPFEFTPTDGTKAYEAGKIENDYLYLNAVEKMEAYKPYILYNELGFEATLTADADGNAYPGTGIVNVGGLCGVIETTEVTAGYILQNQGDGPCFYRVGSTPFSLRAGKCYLAPVSGSRMLAPRFVGESGVNDITNIPTDGGTLYDLSGRPVVNPAPGNIYILNGQKILKLH